MQELTANAPRRAAHPAGLRKKQGGGMISMLLVLLAVGVLAWLLLKHPSSSGLGTDTAQAVNCERDNARLIAQTGGLGEAYRAGFDRLPMQCRKLLPPPGATDPSAERSPDS